MKKIIIVGILVLLLCGCGFNGNVTSYGGTKEIDIPEGYGVRAELPNNPTDDDK